MTSDHDETSFIAFYIFCAENIPLSPTYKIQLPKNKHSIISTLGRKARNKFSGRKINKMIQ